MKFEYDSRKQCASQMKRIHNFFSATHFAMPLPTVNCQLSTVNWTHTFSAKEKDTETGLSYFGSRYYSSDLSVWLSVDPMADKYPSLSSYTYCANNPVKLVDPNGTHIEVVENDNGTYTVVNGSINKDRNIYIVDSEGKRTGITLGKMLTKYSFFYDEGTVAKGAIIDPHDNRGKDFLSKMVDNPINLYDYIFDKEKGGRAYGEMDFKREVVPDDLRGDDSKCRIYYYQGMPLSGAPGISEKNVYGTARDVGNYTAGYMAGRSGLSWGVARIGFDAYDMYSHKTIGREAPVSREAQKLGYHYGLNSKGIRRILGF